MGQANGGFSSPEITGTDTAAAGGKKILADLVTSWKKHPTISSQSVVLRFN